MSKNKRKRVGEVITALGGPVKLAKALGIHQSAVSNWKIQGRFPDKVSTFRKLRAICAAQGVELEERLFLK